MNNEYFLIEDFILENSEKVCSCISDKVLRNRAVSNVFAANIAEKYFTDNDVDVMSGIHNVSKILEQIDISDIYLKGNNYINVCLCENENCLLVPKSHFDLDICPVAYMFIKIEPDLSSGTVIGFVITDNIETKIQRGDYYKISENEICSFYDVMSYIGMLDDIDLPADYDSIILDFLDGKKLPDGEFLRMLLASKEAREFLKIANNAKVILSAVDFNNIQSITEPVDSPDVPDNALSSLNDLTYQDEPDKLFESQSQEALELFENTNDALEEFQDITALEDVGSYDIGINEAVEEDLNINSDSVVRQHADDEQSPKLSVTEDDTFEIKLKSDSSYIEETVSAESNNDIAATTDDTISLIDKTAVIPDVADDNINDKETAAADSENEVALENVSNIDENTVDESSDVNTEDQFEYTTETTPSLNSLVEDDSELTEEMLDASEELMSDDDYNTDNSSEPIDDLFVNDMQNSENESNEISNGMENKKKASKKSPLFVVLSAFVIAAGLGYYAYNNYVKQADSNLPSTVSNYDEKKDKSNAEEKDIEEAMPVETVENVKTPEKTEEGTSVSIPAIEQNLDASILVSNLNVNWEVPSSYASNSTARRYFVKIGKVLQLNLKTELLLLSKPPITNKITVEVEYNKGAQKFVVKQLNASSGEKQVDDVILGVVKDTLNINLGMNMSVFENLQGNPVLVIKL